MLNIIDFLKKDIFSRKVVKKVKIFIKHFVDTLTQEEFKALIHNKEYFY